MKSINQLPYFLTSNISSCQPYPPFTFILQSARSEQSNATISTPIYQAANINYPSNKPHKVSSRPQSPKSPRRFVVRFINWISVLTTFFLAQMRTLMSRVRIKFPSWAKNGFTLFLPLKLALLLYFATALTVLITKYHAFSTFTLLTIGKAVTVVTNFFILRG